MPVQFETDDVIWKLRYSPDGKRIAAAGDSDVYVINAESGKLIEKLSAAQTSPPQFHHDQGLWTGVRFLHWGAPTFTTPENSKYDGVLSRKLDWLMRHTFVFQGVDHSRRDARWFDISDDGVRFAVCGDAGIQLWEVSELIAKFCSTEDLEITQFKAASDLRKTLLARVAHGMKLEQIYELEQGLLPAQLQNQYVGEEEELQKLMLDPQAKPLNEIKLKLRYGKKIFDVLHMDPGLMVHERVIDVFKAKGFGGWEALPISPQFPEKPDGTYFGLKINSVCGPIIREARESRSDYRFFVDLTKWDGCDLFRPDAHRTFYLVTERVIQALTEAGITGWKAERVTDQTEVLAPLPLRKKTVVATGKSAGTPAIPKVVGSRPPLAKVAALIRKHELERVEDKILASAQQAVYLKCGAAVKGTGAIGATRIGGVPDLPKGFAWPRHDNKPLAFLAQLRLADFLRLADIEGMPTDGLISFFAPYDAQKTWTIDKGGSQVLYAANMKDLVQLTEPVDLHVDAQLDLCGLSLRPIISLPHWESEVFATWMLDADERDHYMDLLETNDALNKTGVPRHQYLGHGSYLQSNALALARGAAAEAGVVAGKSESWRMILQLDDDDKAGLSWSGSGRLHVFVPEKDLSNARFERAWMVVQHT